MARRRGGSAGMVVLFALGLVIWGLTEAYQFMVAHWPAVLAVVFVGSGFGITVHALMKWLNSRSKPLVPLQVKFKLESISQAAGSQTGASTARSDARWVTPGEAVTVQGVGIDAGMFYLGSGVVVGDSRISAQYVINPKLSAASKIPDVAGTSMPYWPSYAEMTPSARRGFLEWMAGGRTDPACGIGHVFLFFYGLEHKLFVENDVGSAPALIEEVQRLLSVYAEINSFKRYADEFLNCARIAAGIPLLVPEPTPDLQPSAAMDTAVRLHLGRRIAENGVVDAQDALLWVLALPDVYLRTPAVRCFDEFQRLWSLRFESKYRGGMPVRPSGRIDIRYRAASGAFEADVNGCHEDWPDPLQITRTASTLKRLVETCTTELEPFSRLVGRKPGIRGSTQAALLLPDLLRRDPKGGIVAEFNGKMAEVMGDQNRASSTMRKLLKLAGFEISTGKVAPAIADQLGELLDQVGIAIEPDRRYGGSVPQLDDQVIVFKAAKGGPVDAARPNYRAMKAQVEVAVLAAAADGEASHDELQHVIDLIRSDKSLGAIEQARLIGYTVTVFNSPPKQARVLRKLAEHSAEEREAIARAALAVVGGAEHVDPNEVKFLERLHKALGLPKERVYSDLHRAALPPADEPVALTQEQRVSGIPIPVTEEPNPIAKPQTAVSTPTASVQIDAERLARTQRETQAVAALLSNIFSEDAPEDIEIAAQQPEADMHPAFEGLDAAHAELVEMLEIKGSVSQIEFEQRAKEMKLLPAGAVERINEWSFDRFGEAMIEEGQEITMVPDLRGRLAELREAAE
uniref:Tellurite resistance protein TerB n=1 Tax=Rhodopseudomonas palustris (strain BisA53) TaxID=316055 RepID=Q07NU9_RHOP5